MRTFEFCWFIIYLIIQKGIHFFNLLPKPFSCSLLSTKSIVCTILRAAGEICFVNSTFSAHKWLGRNSTCLWSLLSSQLFLLLLYIFFRTEFSAIQWERNLSGQWGNPWSGAFRIRTFSFERIRCCCGEFFDSVCVLVLLLSVTFSYN